MNIEKYKYKLVEKGTERVIDYFRWKTTAMLEIKKLKAKKINAEILLLNTNENEK